MANHIELKLDLAECMRLAPFFESAVESGLLEPEEAVRAIADQARIVLSDGSLGRTLGEMSAR